MSQPSNRWDAMSVVDYEDRATNQTKTRWQKIGAAFTNQDGSINVLLDSLPLNGKVVLQIPMTREEKEARFGGTGQAFRDQAQQQGHYQQPSQQQRQAAPYPQQYGQQQRPPAPPGQGGQGQYQQPPPQQGANRFQRPQSGQQGFQPQPVAPAYTPDPSAPWPGNFQTGWQRPDGTIVTDPSHLPVDHPDHIPF